MQRPPGIRQCFQARGDVHATTEDIVLLDDDVAEIDPDPEPDPAVVGQAGLAIDHCPLQFSGAADGVHDARKFHQHANRQSS